MAEEFDLDAFKAFVASKPADEKYNSGHCEQCALGQFGFVVRGWTRGAIRRAGVPAEVFNASAYGLNTFGALSHRLGEVNQSRRGI